MDEKRLIKRIKLDIFISIYLILFLFLVFSEFFNAFFNIKYDNDGLNLIARIRLSFKPMVMALYVVFTTIIYVRIIKYLSPLFQYLTDKVNYEKARIAAIKIPWMMISFQIFAWSLGTTVYYALRGWQAESGIPFIFGMLLKVVSGFISALYCAFVINLILKEAKGKLCIVDIKTGENDKFSRNKDYLAVISSILFILINFSYIAYYYSCVSGTISLGNFLINTLPFGIILFVLGLIPIYLSKQEYKYQIKTLMKELKNLSSKHNDFSERIYLVNFDELGEMSAFVNTILYKFRSLLENIKSAVNKLAEASNALSSTSQETFSISNQQAAAVAEVVSTMEDSDRLSKSIGDKAKDVLSKSIKMNELVAKGDDIMVSNLETSCEVKKANEKTIDFIEELTKDIKAIRDVVMIINSIADQVKIIAFNAELEASAAGEAGKNFEIVASEIRRLADNTFTSTTEIKNKIGIIEKSGIKLIEASKSATDLIEDGLKISKNAGDIFQQILNSSTEASSSSKSIEQNISMQILGFEQILQGMKQISEGVSYSADSTKTTSETATDLFQLVESLKKMLDI